MTQEARDNVEIAALRQEIARLSEQLGRLEVGAPMFREALSSGRAAIPPAATPRDDVGVAGELQTYTLGGVAYLSWYDNTLGQWVRVAGTPV